MSDQPTAVDLFCGGGGFSEGLRQAGFDITHAIDIESKACATYRLNHPETEVIEADIMDIEPDDLPSDVDVVFGSPPCTEFSWANAGGGGDIEAGMQLVKRFIYLVGALEPDYWVMENVPRLDNYLPETIDFDDIPWSDRTDSIDITKAVLESDDYGAPQRRSRLFSGQFPVPEPTDEHAPTFGEIADAFPRAADGVPADETIQDPNYDIELPADELTDHFYISHVTHREAEEIRVRKEDHSFYGRMQFPDDPTVPSRTVLATNRRVARETLVMEDTEAPEGLSRFRKPTIREIATIQSFPITYQFTGSSQAQKWRRVGDAVPVKVAFAVGQALREALGHNRVAEPALRDVGEIPQPETNLNDRDLSYKGRRSLSIARNFRHHIPVDNKQRFRVDVETDKETTPPHPLADVVDSDLEHPVAYRAVLYRGYSTDVVSTPIDLPEVLDRLDTLLAERPELEPIVQDAVARFTDRLGPQIPDTTTLQAIRSRRAERDEPLEYTLLHEIADYEGTGIVDEVLPKEAAADVADQSYPDLFEDGTNLPVRVLLKLLGATYLSVRLNECARWIRTGPDGVFIQEAHRDAVEPADFAQATCTCETCVDTMLRERFDLETTTAAVENPAATSD